MMKFPVEDCIDCHVHVWAAQLGMQHVAGAIAHTTQHLMKEPVKLDD